MSFRHLFIAAAVAASSLAFGAAPPATAVGGGVAPPCDRACMTGLVDRYLAAVVRHDPAGLPLNRDVKFTESATSHCSSRCA
jgi:hypothetical protein